MVTVLDLETEFTRRQGLAAKEPTDMAAGLLPVTVTVLVVTTEALPKLSVAISLTV
jgi:hypothetical protein